MLRVRVHALEPNRRFPEPLDESEVKQTAYSISAWCWSGAGVRWHFDHSSAAQRRRRAKSGKVRRARNAERVAGIVAGVSAGQNMSAPGTMRPLGGWHLLPLIQGQL